MNFKIGDKVKVVSLINTKAAFDLDEAGIMETSLNNNIYTIEDIAIYNKQRVYLSFRDIYGGSYVWHEDDLRLVGSKELEIE